ncbi:UDP-N-acetylenolpyruvoylglucosamine reductase [Candidatus Peribacteria bacterium RIFCSPHIGHO2_01_FULL_51_35]|nr:MAG: UDP-N-acetylenolpyruvoylglucosamine reductase [Candidatus Peribacteria bacterium RIFCSPHIGHO2_01_FULL_51_35]
MQIQELVAVGSKTTMRIGGQARYYAEIATKEDAEEALRFSKEKNIPLIILGSGSNTVFADGVIEALVVRIKADKTSVEGNQIRVEAGKNLAMLINELAKQNLDLSALTGIPGTLGGAVFGNAGQGQKGIWIEYYVKDVTALIDGRWQTLPKAACEFKYRESVFKHMKEPLILWEVILEVPTRDRALVEAEVKVLLQKRIETQPHIKTAGSCFKAVGDTPAWKLIDAAGLRGTKIGDVQIAEKHANFLLNIGKANYEDAKAIVKKVKKTITEPLDVEMRFIEPDGSLAF